MHCLGPGVSPPWSPFTLMIASAWRGPFPQCPSSCQPGLLSHFLTASPPKPSSCIQLEFKPPPLGGPVVLVSLGLTSLLGIPFSSHSASIILDCTRFSHPSFSETFSWGLSDPRTLSGGASGSQMGPRDHNKHVKVIITTDIGTKIQRNPQIHVNQIKPFGYETKRHTKCLFM